MSIVAAAASRLSSQHTSNAPARALFASFTSRYLIRTFERPIHARAGRASKRRRPPVAPYSSLFHIPPASSIRSLYRALLRAATHFPDDLVRWYISARCRTEWREHRAAHREKYRDEKHAAYEKQKARLQVRERLQRIQGGESDQAATQAALDLHFDALQLPPLHLLHITTETPRISLDLRRTIDQRYKDAQQHLQLLHTALHHPDPPTLINCRTELLCAAYGWQGGAVLDRLFHLRNMYINAPNMLQPNTLLALHPLHRYLVTGVPPEDERLVPPADRIMGGRRGGRRPAVGVYEWWPVERSDRLRGEALVSGGRWMECYRLLIMERCQVLDVQWRRAYSDMLKQKQIIGAPGEAEQPGTPVQRNKNSEAEERKVEKDKADGSQDEHPKRVKKQNKTKNV